MDKQSQQNLGFTDEVCKGDLRIRLTQFQSQDNTLRCVVSVSAWSQWMDQEKLLHAWGGMDLQDARNFFTMLSRDLRGYDWHDNKVVLEGR